MSTLLSRLMLWQKFALTGAIALCMAALPTVLVLKSSGAQMGQARAEAASMAPVADLLKLIQLTQQHRGMSGAYLSGNDGVATARQDKHADIDAAYARAGATLSAWGHPAVRERTAAMQVQWASLAAQVKARSLKPADSLRLHTALITEELAVLDQIIDLAALNLDASPGAYHLIQAALVHLPPLTEAMGQLRGTGVTMLAGQQFNPEDKARLQVLAGLVRREADAVQSSLRKAMASDPAMASRLGAPVAAADSATQAALRLTDTELIKPAAPTIAAPAYLAQMTPPIDVQFQLVDSAFTVLKVSLEQRVADEQRQLAILLTLIVSLAGGGAWTMLQITRHTTGALRSALHLAARVGEGDLTARVEATGRDEIAQLLDALSTMQAQLKGLVSAVRGGADSIAIASAQIATGNADLSQRTESQASSLQETAASMEQMTASVKTHADTARQATQMAGTASEAAQRGGQLVGDVVSTMAEITQSSRKIEDIIGVIDGIAFQTNILALNAAVEAARAGEQGRGFAVVAAEVRSLAQRSAGAAREIKSLIGTSVGRIEDGARQVGQAGSTMQDIVTQVQHVAELIGAMSASSDEQTAGIDQVGLAVSHLDQTTQQNAALVEQSAAAAESLREQASGLVQTMSRFKLGQDSRLHRPEEAYA